MVDEVFGGREEGQCVLSGIGGVNEYLKKMSELNDQNLVNRIFLVNGIKVMLDSDLADLYHVPTKRLNEQVKRNRDRFPKDFMFQLTIEQWENLKSQNATSSWGGRRNLPYAFTEHGVAMLSRVLKSKIAIQVNIQVIRVFIKMREVLLTNKELLIEINKIRRQVDSHDEKIELIFNYLKQFVNDKEEQREPIGFQQKGRG